MAKMIIALALAAPSALAFTHYVPNTDEPTPAPANGCGDPCADVIGNPGRRYLSEALRPSGHLRISTPPRAQVQTASGADITVSEPGKAVVSVRNPRPLRPRENKGTRNAGLKWRRHLRLLRQPPDGDDGPSRTNVLPLVVKGRRPGILTAVPAAWQPKGLYGSRSRGA